MTSALPGRPPTQRRSRFGCRNCKLRKVKCDQGKPRCKRCICYGVLCNSLSSVPDLQPIAADTGGPLVIHPPVASAVWTSDASTSYQYQLNAKCQDFITRHLGRSLTTPHDPNMVHVNSELLRLAFAYPCLMHASLAVAFSYDRHLNSPLGCHRSLEECYHWSQSTTLFNKQLQKPIKQAKEKDAIWGTAAALAILTFSCPDARTPEESWPLSPFENCSFLDWLRISNGKMSLWHIINPLRPDSIFCVMADTFAIMDSPLPDPESDIADIQPRALAALCRLDSELSYTGGKNNPYFYAAHAVSQTLNLPDTDVTTGHIQLFTRSVHGPFEELLREKDPVALLLLYLWYHKASRSIWWIELRARVESPAICCYLQLYHRGNAAVQAFLPGGAFAGY
ncbi:hypothetical protein BJX99DRAFT_78195 [Aspergillus californicus]